MQMIIDCISDLHGHYPKLEGGDLLIIAGDLCQNGDSENEFALFDYWMNEQKYTKKIVIAGNHDNVLSENHIKFQFCEYLCDSGTEFEGLKIWGSPWTLAFAGMNPLCMAFTQNYGCDSDSWLAEKWALIPDETDILITHSPPHCILDIIPKGDKLMNVGSISLLKKLDTLKPKLHVFGHIHENGGKKIVFKRPGYGTENNTICVNASHVDERYRPKNAPVRIIL